MIPLWTCRWIADADGKNAGEKCCSSSISVSYKAREIQIFYRQIDVKILRDSSRKDNNTIKYYYLINNII